MTNKSVSIYISRQFTSIIGDKDLPFESDADGKTAGVNSRVGRTLLFIRLTVPLAKIYLILAFFRELFQCEIFHSHNYGGNNETDINTIYETCRRHSSTLIRYLPTSITTLLLKSRIARSLYVQLLELWMIVEILFELSQRFRFQRVASISPIECSLAAAPLMEPSERASLWRKIMSELEMEGDMGAYLTGWFFDLDGVESLTKYDVRDFYAWSLFEGRNIEHLTYEERSQLKQFIEELEWRLSFHMYGELVVLEELEEENDEDEDSFNDRYDSGLSDMAYSSRRVWNVEPNKRPKPRKEFRFASVAKQETAFVKVYDALKKKYKLDQVVVGTDRKGQSTYEIASSAYDNVMSIVGEKGGSGGSMRNLFSSKDKLEEIWQSVSRKKERRELKKKLKGYRTVLSNMRSKGSIATSEMTAILKKITKCEEGLMELEQDVLTDFYIATEGSGNEALAKKVIGGHQHYKPYKPNRYCKYSHDPLLGLTAHYPLGYHLGLFGLTEGLLRFILSRKGFTRKKIASTIYYYHPGEDSNTNKDNTPIVWIHGIGVGNIYYLGLIEQLLALKRPIFLPEIPYVCGFRPWQNRNFILSPNAVVSTLTGMLASRGFLKATFVGHSYGTSWLSYMCKYANHAVASVLFLDPICFCLYHAGLTRSFVYHRSDPGSTSYLIKADFIINYTIQRSFPWARIVLFLDDIPQHIPVRIYLSDKDFLVPAKIVENYFRKSKVSIVDFREGGAGDLTVGQGSNAKEEMRGVFVFRGGTHGGWCLNTPALHHIASTAKILTDEYERRNDQ